MTEGTGLPLRKENLQEGREEFKIVQQIDQASLDLFTFVVSAYTRLRSDQGEYRG